MIIPAILENNFDAIRERVDAVRGFAEWVQIDLVDGAFARNTTWPYASGDIFDLQELPDSISIELHLMINNPQLLVEKLVELPVGRVLFHLESFSNPDELREVFSVVEATHGMSAGLALKAQTEPAAIAPFLDIAHTIQLMGIRAIGMQGQPFDESIYARIQALRAIAPDGIIEVDGGITLENAQRLLDAGADNLVVGSAIFAAEDIENAYANFNALFAS